MKKLKEKLANPFAGSKGKKEFQDECAKIAEELFNNYCIECGEKNDVKRYYFAEIEFYYYDKENFKDEWNKKTYPRDDKEAGDLFFHYSGFDICFESKYSEGKFGGILIRSLFDKENNRYITGPLLCANEVLNACSKSHKWPEIVPTKRDNCEIAEPIERYGIGDEKLCFFVKGIISKNKFINYSWDFKSEKSKDIIKYYHRF